MVNNDHDNGDSWWFMMINDVLIGGAITILNNMKVNGKDDIPYMKWKIKVMFETTKQCHIVLNMFQL